MADIAGRKLTKEQRERLRARRSEGRDRLRASVSYETRLACFLYVGGCDGELTTSERSFMRREYGSAQRTSIPSRDELSRRVRSFLLGCRPSLRERRELLAHLVEFARCDGALSSDEDEALRAVEDMLELSREARSARRRSWRSAAGVSTGTKKTTSRSGSDWRRRSSESTRDRARTSHTQSARTHWSYEYLGCSEQDTDETIKRCYRRLAVKLHPDKHAARTTTPEETLSHLREFQKLQQAYEAIWRIRGRGAAR